MKIKLHFAKGICTSIDWANRMFLRAYRYRVRCEQKQIKLTNTAHICEWHATNPFSLYIDRQSSTICIFKCHRSEAIGIGKIGSHLQLSKLKSQCYFCWYVNSKQFAIQTIRSFLLLLERGKSSIHVCVCVEKVPLKICVIQWRKLLWTFLNEIKNFSKKNKSIELRFQYNTVMRTE